MNFLILIAMFFWLKIILSSWQNDFQVEDYHTYHVSGLGVLVHNAGDYSNLKDSKYVGEGKKFTKAQKRQIIQENMRRNGGKIKSDMSGKELVPATQIKLNVTPDPLEVQIDHIKPRSSGGSNSYSNAQVLSREENIFKSNKWGKIMFDIDENTMVITTVDIINKKRK